MKPSKNNLHHLSHSFRPRFLFSSVVYIQYTPSSKRNLYSKIKGKSEAVYFFSRFYNARRRGDEEKDGVQGAQSPRNRSNLGGCEDSEGFCNEAIRFFFAPYLVLDFLKGLTNLRLNLVAQLDIVGKQLLHGLASLGKLLVAVAEP